MGYQIIKRGGGASGDSFKTIQTPAGTSPVADSATDTLTFTSDDGSVIISGDSTTDTIDFSVAAADDIDQNTQRYVDPINGDDSNSGSILSPFQTIQAALNDLDAVDVTDYDATTRVQVVLSPGVYTENLTIPRRKIVDIVLNSSLITGNVTWNLDGSFFSGTHQQKLIIRGNDHRSMYTGVNIPLVGIDGDITVNGTLLSGSTPQLHILQAGVSGDITFDSTDVSGYNSQTFISEGFYLGDIIVVPAKGIASSLYAKNSDTSSSMALGGISGRVTLAILTNSRLLRPVVASGTGGGRWVSSEFKAATAHDFTGYAGTVSCDATTFGSWYSNVPTKGTVTPVLLDVARGVAVTPAGNLAATDVQAALTELQSDVDGRANTALSNLASTAVNVDILPATDNGVNLGSLVKRFGYLYGGVLYSSEILVENFDDPGNYPGNIYYEDAKGLTVQTVGGGNQSITIATSGTGILDIVAPSAQLNGSDVLNTDDYAQVGNKDLAHDSVNFVSVSNGYTRFNQTGGAFETQLVVPSTAARVITLPDQTATLATLNDYDPSYRYYRFWDFDSYVQVTTSGDTGFTGVFSGAGASFQVAGGVVIDGNHPGLLQLKPGTSATGYIGALQGAVFNLGAGVMTTEYLVRFDQLSNGTDTYVALIGLGRDFAAATDFTSGLYFRYTHGTNSGKFEFKSAAAGSRTTVDTGITVAANTWYKLKIVVNAAGTSAQAYIDGAAAGTAISTNLPNTTAAQSIGLNIHFENTVGTGGGRIFYCDYVKHEYVFTTPR